MTECHRCHSASVAKGYCPRHYAQAHRSGMVGGRNSFAQSTVYRRMDTVERFLSLVEKSDGCWNWIGYKNDKGYGQIQLGKRPQKRTIYAHRYSYELVRGPILSGLQIDHLCRNRACVNPDHLEPVTNRENYLRGMAPSAVIHRSGTCSHGHEQTAENIYIRPDTGKPSCLACRRVRNSLRNHDRDDICHRCGLTLRKDGQCPNGCPQLKPGRK